MAAKRTKRTATQRKAKAASAKIEKVMHEFKHGTLRLGGSGKKVTARPQAIAIALSEAGQSQTKPKARRRPAPRTLGGRR